MFGKSGRDMGDKKRGGGLSVIGADVVITGDVAAGDELRVDGRIDGNVRCGALDQGEGGIVAGDIEAEEGRIAGTVRGRVTVRSLVLEASARVTGDVSYESLSVAAGARVDGRFAHRGGESAAASAETAADPAPAEPVAELFSQAAE